MQINSLPTEIENSYAEIIPYIQAIEVHLRMLRDTW